MKKLMTMLAAVGMAFGLFAETDLPSSTSFESASEFTGGKLNIGGSTKWTCADEGATLSQTEYNDGEAYPYSNTARYKFSDTEPDPQDYYLTIKTAFDKPLNRSFTEAAAADKAPVYIDQLVKFTAADEDMEISDSTAKIGVWVKEIYDADGETVTDTRLFVTAGPVVGTEPTVYDLGSLANPADWHRLTIKAIKAQTAGTELGYEVFVDGVALDADKAGYSNVSGLTVQAQALNAAKKIFPAMVTGLGVASLGIAGQGGIDDMMTTMTSPGEWAEDKMIKFGYTADFTKLVYTVHGAKTTIDNITEDGFVSIPYASDMTITIDTAATTLKPDYIIKGVSGKGATYNNGVITVAEGADFVLEGKDNAQRIQIGNQFYPNFGEAIAAIPAGAAAELVLNQDVDVLAIDAEGVKVTEADFSGKGDITIDLNGKTITGKADDVLGYVVTHFGNLVITNSQATGGIAMADDTDYTGVVYVGSPDANDRKLTIYGGQFDGAVAVDTQGGEGIGKVTSEVSGGKFLRSANAQPGTDGGLTIAAGFKLGASAGDYWEIVAKEKYTISVTGAANATVKINDQDVTSIELTEGEAYNIVVTPNANYEYAEGGSYGDFTLTEGKLTKSGTATATDSFAAANATAVVYSFDYMDGETVFASQDYTVETGSITLNEGKKDGYTFINWYPDEECAEEPITDAAAFLQGLKENPGEVKAIYGKWEKAGPDWPDDPTFPSDADDDVKAKYAAWAEEYGVTTLASADAFLLNVDPAISPLPELKITSIEVADDVATITVSADGANLATVNGVLYLELSDDLQTWESYQKPLAGQIDAGVWTVQVKNAPFMKAKVGFKDPDPVE